MHTILVVDDNLDAAELMAKLLQFHGYNTACAGSGESALEFIQASKPAMVILDAMMPGMDGIEVLRRVRADPLTAALAVVIYTGISDDAHRDQALSNGADDYWVKARFNFDELKLRIDALLKDRQSNAT